MPSGIRLDDPQRVVPALLPPGMVHMMFCSQLEMLDRIGWILSPNDLLVVSVLFVYPYLAEHFKDVR